MARKRNKKQEERQLRTDTTPSEFFITLKKLRLEHWRAVITGGDTVATLKAWANHLAVPRTIKGT